MKFWLTAAILCSISFGRAAAQSAMPEPCATVMSPGALQSIRDWTANAASAKTTAIADTVALTVHLVGTDGGTGFYSLSSLWKLICKTNERFAPTGIYFQLQWPLHYIQNTLYYSHDFNTGYDMIQAESVPGTVNAFFVSQAGGACGYFFGGTDAVVVANGCAGLNSTTLVHELGHFFGLPHTFNGWEGGNVPPNPERVTRTGPFANCANAGDGFCDTEADFIHYRWPCPASAVRYDDLGARYRPDSSIYMSYSSDVCQSRFSSQQMGYMQYDLANYRQDLLLYNPQPYHALDTPNVTYPVDTMWVNDRRVRWQAVPGADRYHVVIKRTVSGLLMKDTLVSGTSLLTTHPVADYNRYTATVTPLASSNVCASKARAQTYTYSPIANPLLSVGGAVAEDEGLRLYPNPAGAGGWTVQIPNAPRGPVQCTLFSVDGRMLRRVQAQSAGGSLSIQLPADGLSDGVYFIRVEGTGAQWTTRAVLRK